MMIHTMYLWPLGCLAALGFAHLVFAIEEAFHRVMSK